MLSFFLWLLFNGSKAVFFLVAWIRLNKFSVELLDVDPWWPDSLAKLPTPT